jgi:hypothetical protein
MKEWLNPFSSFRARIVFFVLLVLFLINRHSEQRITGLVADQLRDTSLSVDLAQTSFSAGKYPYMIMPDGNLFVFLRPISHDRKNRI